MYKIDINFVSENILCTRTQNIQSLNSKHINIQTHRLEYDIHNSGGFFFQISMTHHYRITIIKELSTFAFSSSCHKLYTPGKLGKMGLTCLSSAVIH